MPSQIRFGILGKLGACFGVLLGMTALIGLGAWWYVHRLELELNEVVVNNLGAASALATAERGLWELRFALPNYLQNDVEARDQIRARAAGWEKQVDDGIMAYSRLSLSPPEQQALTEWHASYQRYLEARPTYFDLIDAGRIEDAKAFRSRSTNPPAAAAVRALATLIGLQEHLGKERRTQVAARAQAMSRLLVLTLTVSLVLGGILAVLFARHLIIPLRRSVEVAGKVARGDLSDSLSTARSDEIGELLNALGKMISGLREIISELQEGAQNLSTVAIQLAARAGQQSQDITAQAAALQQAVAALDEIRMVASQTSSLAKSVQEDADRSVETARSGQHALSAAVTTTAELGNRFRILSEAVQALGTRSAQAGEVATSVSDFAEQSQLLALNATIEAAHAGELGKGFRIVAVEMRRLATASKQATVRIGSILNDLDQAVETTVASTEEGGRLVASGTRRVGDVGEHLQLLQSVVTEAAHAAQRIEAAARQQLGAVEDIGATVQKISEAASEQAAGAREQDAAAHELSRVSQTLRGIVARYRMT